MNEHRTAEYWIERLGLNLHPEGGYFRETYRSVDRLTASALPEQYESDRVFSTAIYFLLRGTQVSRLHRLKSDELWHFHAGSSAAIHLIEPDGGYAELRLGPDLDRGESFQHVIPAGCWFGATVDAADSYTLVGCTVAPGFDFADFELGERNDLLARYPDHREIIERLTGKM